MRETSGVTWPAATDQRKARECNEERGRGRQAATRKSGMCLAPRNLTFALNSHTIQLYMLDIGIGDMYTEIINERMIFV